MKYFVTLPASSLFTGAAFAADKPTHATRDIAGWAVREDDRLLKGLVEATAELRQLRK